MDIHEGPVTVSDLPCRIKMDIPPQDNSLSNFFFVVGGVILAVGVGFIFFGPETIYYDRYEGMTFVQVLQAYPGPIATLGGLMMGLASKAAESGTAETNRHIDAFIMQNIHIEDSDIPPGFTLSMAQTGEPGVVLLSLEPKPAEEEAAPTSGM
ncbi:hypothetical protein JCM19237_3082 [Photobacterium aphoticum]|uniref:Uncharacterized protein n=1 Tax=Photobacterium aphoticum TaxID=754436 RepID=A0A090RHS8_9GAMM|nr:hypothetical protein JCM19237_3082 [Photobacterium aphoticum]